MKDFIKYLGIIIVLLGVLVLVISAVASKISNPVLAVGGTLMVLGLIAHVVINKYVDLD